MEISDICVREIDKLDARTKHLKLCENPPPTQLHTDI